MHAKFYNECTLNNQIITAVYDLLGQPSYFVMLYAVNHHDIHNSSL